MTEIAMLTCLRQLQCDLQLQNMAAMTNTIDHTLRALLHEAATAHGHGQVAIDAWLSQNGTNLTRPVTTDQIQSIRRLCFVN